MQGLRRQVMLAITALALLVVPLCSASLTFTCTTPKSSTDHSKPNTFIGTAGGQIATSLLASGTPAMLWGTVPSASIRDTCNLIVNTGTHTVSANVAGDSWGGASKYTINLQLQATGGCNSAADNSGTEFVFTDPNGRKIALVCPQGAGTKGCGIYWTGSDVSSLYSKAGGKASSGRRLQSSRQMLDCSGGAGAGAAVTGVAAGSVAADIGGSAACLALGPFAPLCVAGVVGVSAAVGAGVGCAVDNSCFPGNARVMTSFTSTTTMDQLAVGDKIGVMGANNMVAFEEVYAFGHQDGAASTFMVRLQLSTLQQAPASGPVLTLSPYHFIPRIDGVQMRATDAKLGDLMWARQAGSHLLAPHNITGITQVLEQGLFNPLTLGGTIVVDNVVASVHSEWFLDAAFGRMGFTALLPSAYQAVLAPARALFHILGKDRYVRLYHFLDGHLDIAAFGTAYGGKIAAGAGAGATVLLAAGMASNKALVYRA